MRVIQLVFNLFYTVILFAAANATDGLLQAACLTAAILNAIGTVATVMVWALVDAKKKTLKRR